MKIAAILASAIALAGAAAAAPIESRQDNSSYPECGPSTSSSSPSLIRPLLSRPITSSIRPRPSSHLHPKTRLTLPASATGAFYYPSSVTVSEPFALRFCSGTYFKTSSKSITLAISAAGDTNLDRAVILTDELTSPDYKTYDFEAVVPKTMFTFPEETYLIVVEKTNDYYVVSRMAFPSIFEGGREWSERGRDTCRR